MMIRGARSTQKRFDSKKHRRRELGQGWAVGKMEIGICRTEMYPCRNEGTDPERRTTDMGDIYIMDGRTIVWGIEMESSRTSVLVHGDFVRLYVSSSPLQWRCAEFP